MANNPWQEMVEHVMKVRDKFNGTEPLVVHIPIEEMPGLIAWMEESGIPKDQVILKDVEELN